MLEMIEEVMTEVIEQKSPIKTRPVPQTYDGETLLDRRQVEKIVKLSTSAIYRYMREGHFPKPIRTGPGSVRWTTSSVTAWIKARIAESA